MPLTKEEITYLLSLTQQKIVVEPSNDFPFTVTAKDFGYSSDSKIGGLQAKLSVMLQMASKSGL